MTTHPENHKSDVHFAQKTLHDFNNQIFRVSLLTESLGQKIQSDQEPGEAIDSLIQKIQEAVFESAESGKKLAILVGNHSKPTIAQPQDSRASLHGLSTEPSVSVGGSSAR